MNTVTSNADVWVIAQGKALLFRCEQVGWQQEMSMPFEEFLGSATALSSFTLSDTRVFYNLRNASDQPVQPTEHRWVGLREDPLRILEIPSTGIEQKEIQALQTMGKKVHVITCAEPVQFERGTAMMLLSSQETKHLDKWVSCQKQGVGRLTSNLILLKNLWLKPDSSWQVLRVAVVGCTLFTLAIAQHFSQAQLARHEENFVRDLQQAAKVSTQHHVHAPWQNWAQQIGKFGKDERANLNALNVYWNEEGLIHTQASLNRARKRLPKGCLPESTVNASCQISGVSP